MRAVFRRLRQSAKAVAASSTPARVAAAMTGTAAAGIACASVASASAATLPAAEVAASMRKPKVIFVLGGPGAGKGTQCERIVEEYGYTHLSAGDLLRKERDSGSPQGDMIQSYIKEGNIVPVAVTVGLLRKAMLEAGNDRFLIDGFPRNEDNLKGWFDVMGSDAEVEMVLFYDADDDVRLGRLLQRAKTSGRTDDKEDVIRKRFAVFYEQTMPIIDHFAAEGRVATVDGAPPVDEVFAATRAALEPVIAKEVLRATNAALLSIDTLDAETYAAVTDVDVTAIEPESRGVPVEGAQFHLQEFAKAREALAIAAGEVVETDNVSRLSDLRIRLLGSRWDSAVVSYVRQRDGAAAVAETRVLERRGGRWAQVHSHRSPVQCAAAAREEAADAEAAAEAKGRVAGLEASLAKADQALARAERALAASGERQGWASVVAGAAEAAAGDK